MPDLKTAMPVFENDVGEMMRADELSASSATPINEDNVVEEVKATQEPAAATLGSFLKGLVTGDSLPKEVQTYNIKFEEKLQANPEERKVVKTLLMPEWEALQSVKSGIVGYLNKEQDPESPFSLQDRSLLEVPIIKKALSSPEYVNTYKNVLKMGANLSFNTPTSPLFFMPNASKKSLVDRIEKMTPDEVASLGEVSGDMLTLGAIGGAMGLLNKYSITQNLKYKKTLVPKMNLEGKGYNPAEIASINKVNSTIEKFINKGSEDPFRDVMINRKTYSISPQELNLWKGAHSIEKEVYYGAGLPVPKEPAPTPKEAKIVPVIGQGMAKKPTSKPPKEVVEEAEETTEFWSGLPVKQGKERGFGKSVEAAMPALKYVAGQYIPRSTDELAIKAKNLIKEDFKTAQQMAKTLSSDAEVAVGAELLKHYVDEAENATSQVTKDALYKEATELANSMAEQLTEAGRTVQATSILARMTPEGQLRFAARQIQKYNEEVEKFNENPHIGPLRKKIPELTPEQTKDIISRMEEIMGMPEGDAKAIKFKELQDMISNLIPSKMMDKVITVWKAGLLTGLQTTGTNTLSNITHFITEIIKDLPASAVDTAISTVTGKRTMAFTTKGISEGMKEGAEKGWRFLKTGYDERNILAKYDYHKVNFGTGKIAKALNAYTEVIFRFLGAQDQPFYYGAFMHSLYSQATAEAINQGLTGQAKTDFVKNMVMNPEEANTLYAIEDALIAVFQNPTMLGKVAKAIQNIPGMGEIILPFGKTPSAVATQILNYSPIGIIKTAAENIGKGKFKQRAFAQGMGRAFTGLPFYALGAYMLSKMQMTLDRPKTEAEQKLWEMEGKKPFAIKVGGKWRDGQILGPAWYVMVMGAYFGQGMKETGSFTASMAQAVAGGYAALKNQTFVQGLARAAMALDDPVHRGASFVNSMIGSTIPTIVKNIAIGTDKKARRVNSPMDSVIERLPILRQILEPKIDVFGRDVDRTNNFLETMADPTRPTKILTDPVVGEIRRLVDEGNKVHTSQLGDRGGYKVLSPKQNTALFREAGSMAYERITEYISDPNYEGIPDSEKTSRINSILEETKSIAKVNAAIERTANLAGNARREVVAEMINDGLLNKEDYEVYKRSR